MIIEQAFVSLPELLLGNRSAVQDYEVGLVGLFSMAILQELNGRNVPYPIRHLQAERRYGAGSGRRVDLFVNVKRLMIANQSLESYGWRHHNWIEAKYYRNKSPRQRHATNKTLFQRQLIADLVRLTCLVPIQVGNPDSNGRYFLHVYDDEPKFYLSYEDRAWVRTLHQAGAHRDVIVTLSSEPETARAQFGPGLQDLKVQASVTNFLNVPISVEGADRRYWCILTRLDDYSVQFADRWFQVHANRTTAEGRAGDYDAIRTHVAAHLGTSKPTETDHAPATGELRGSIDTL